MEILKRNWKIKLLSLALAILFWSFVIVLENPKVSSRITNIPIIFNNMNLLEAKGLSINGDIRKTVDLVVSGQRNRIINLTPQHIRVTADFSNLEEGTQVVKLNYSTPDEISIEDEPQSINVVVEKNISKEFAVNVKNNGTIPDNYILESTKVTPEKVTIKGLRSKLESINNVSAVLDLSNLKKDMTINQEIKAYTEDGTEVKDIVFGQEFVNVNVVVKKSKEVNINPILVGELNKNYKIEKSTLNKSKIYVTGPEAIIDNLESVDTQDIDISKLNKSERIPVKLSLPSDITQLNEDTNFYIDIEIQEKSTKEFSISKDRMKVNISSSYDYSIENESAKLVLIDFATELEKINNENIEFDLDLIGKTSGTYDLSPIVKLNGKSLDLENIKSVDKIKIVVNEKSKVLN